MKKTIYTLVALFAAFTIANAQTARLQVIHNSADPAAASVDIYLNDGATPLLDNFAFRKASPFVDAPAGVPIKISVCAPTSTDSKDPIKTFTVTLAAGKKYVAVASGLVGTGFAANPDKINTEFGLVISDVALESSTAGNVSFAVMHGATDAPTVDVEALGVGTLVNNAPFKGFTPYLTVPAAEYVINVKDSASKGNVASYKVDLSTLGGGAAVVFASGFLDPSKNKSGSAFGLFAALASGTVVPFGPSDKALLQVIHNAPQLAATTVDLFVNGGSFAKGFKYRTATKFQLVPAGVVLNIAVSAPGKPANDSLAKFTATLGAGKTYLAIASGIIGGTTAENPNGINTAFTLLTKENVKYTAAPGKTSLHVVHGSPDAPTVDVVARGVATIVDNAAYKAITDEIEVPSANYTLDIKDATGVSTVASFSAPLSGLAGKSAVVLASGFFAPKAPETNAFGLIAVLADGTVIVLPSAPTSIEGVAFNNFSIYPVPASDLMYVNLNSEISSDANFQMMDMSGRVINSGKLNFTSGSNRLEFNVSNLEVGNYLLKISSSKNVSNVKFAVSK
ncbi:MAG: DUF4397 domain-containing protein [Cytophagales bacterium]|nr:MAG: DUF4397 domain-containing protein [Cytophagales bacterium]